MTHQLSPLNSNTLPSPSGCGNAGYVSYLNADQAHSHENSSGQSSVSTLQTFIEEIALEDKLKKGKKITKLTPAPTPKKNAPANWTKPEVLLLATLLKKYGSDFTMIATQMTKTRDQIKRKFKVLQKKCPLLAEAIFERESADLQGMVEENDFLHQ